MSEILVEVTRGPIVECVHYGDVAVVNSSGKLLAYAGDPYKFTYFRSSAKPIQAINAFLSGAVDKYEFTDKEIAIMCASHFGEQFHRDTINSMLKKMGLTIEDLKCGSPMSRDRAYMLELVAEGYAWNQTNSDCSGKHCGFLSSSLSNGFETEGYIYPDHPIQKQVVEVISKMCEIPVEKIVIGEDGCGVPVHGMPIYNMALGFAKVANPDKLEENYKNACNRIFKAMNAAPEMIAGTNGICSELIKHSNGKLIAKAGAEAVYTIGVKGMDIGIAIKILDGNSDRGLPASIMEVLKELNVLNATELDNLKQFTSPIPNVNHHKRVVGEVRSAFKLTKLV